MGKIYGGNDEEYLIPRIDTINALYNEIVPMLQKLKTKQDVIDFGDKYHVTMEINYDFASKFDESQPIEVIRCESWGDLDYIYVYTNGSEPLFDVWCSLMDYDFIDGTTITNLEKDYIEGIKWLWFRNKNRKESLFEIISILRLHGTEYNDMVNVYGFDSMIVEEYEAEHYEHGYGDRK